MADEYGREPMLDVFLFETVQLIEQLEQLALDSEKLRGLEGSINEIFRIMHTIKGSAAMMLFTNISSVAHAVEDVFFFLREEKPGKVDYPKLTDIVLESVDFIKAEIGKIEGNQEPDGNAGGLIDSVKSFLNRLKESNSIQTKFPETNVNTLDKPRFYVSPSKGSETPQQKFKAVIFFEEGCEMENIRAFSVLHEMKDFAENIECIPQDIIENEKSVEFIRSQGFQILFNAGIPLEEVKVNLEKTLFLKELQLEKVNGESSFEAEKIKKEIRPEEMAAVSNHKTQQNYISVNVAKMDKLMDLVGELVIAEAMVEQNPDLHVKGLLLNNFNKAARQLRKITNELQDTVMSVRMVPLSATFQKMTRVVRDMCKKLDKEVQLEIVGEETEVDKNIIEHISDPLMHLIRNSLDHGIETAAERLAKGKEKEGRVVLEAKNSGGDVWIIVKDDGKGLDRDKILKKAWENGLTKKSENELTDQEIFFSYSFPVFLQKKVFPSFPAGGLEWMW